MRIRTECWIEGVSVQSNLWMRMDALVTHEVTKKIVSKSSEDFLIVQQKNGYLWSLIGKSIVLYISLPNRSETIHYRLEWLIASTLHQRPTILLINNTSRIGFHDIRTRLFHTLKYNSCLVWLPYAKVIVAVAAGSSGGVFGVGIAGEGRCFFLGGVVIRSRDKCVGEGWDWMLFDSSSGRGQCSCCLAERCHRHRGYL